MSAADQIRALADSGTPGPWHALPGDNTFNPSVGAVAEAFPSLLSSDEWVAECKPAGDADAAKIVAAVNALPKVADHAEAVEAYRAHRRSHGIGVSGDCCSRLLAAVFTTFDALTAALGVSS